MKFAGCITWAGEQSSPPLIQRKISVRISDHSADIMNEAPNSKQYKRLILKGKAVVFIDWANVHGWEKSLKREVDCEMFLSPNKNAPRLLEGRD